MLNSGIVKANALHSVIGESSILAPKGNRRKRDISSELMLTSLIDAFSILMIFLLFSFSSTGDLLMLSKDMELPGASGEQLDRNPVVKFESGKYVIENKEVTPDGLVQALLDVRKTFQEMRPGEEFPGVLTVQADRRVKFADLSAIVQASAQAGFGDIKFAVLMK